MAWLGVKVESVMLWLQHAGAAILAILPKVLLAFLVLFVGCRSIGCLTSLLQASLEAVNIKTRRRDSSLRTLLGRSRLGSPECSVDADEEAPGVASVTSHRINPTLMKFSVSLASKGLKALLLVSVASMLGISTTSFLAVISMSSLSIGLALQGLLKDLAAGVMLLIFKPYEVGDLVDLAGNLGKVSEIGMFETVLHTLDNKTVFLPNSSIRTVINYSAQGVLRVDVALTVSHDASLRKAREVLLGVVAANPQVLQTPKAPEVLLREVDALGRELIMRAWVRSKDFIPAPFALRMEGTLALEEADIALARWPAPTAAAVGVLLPSSPDFGLGLSGERLPTLLAGRRPQAASEAASKSGGQAASVEKVGDLGEHLA